MIQTQNNTLNGKLKSFLSGYKNAYCQSLFDPIQTHAIYGIPKEDKETAKKALKELGGNKFRIDQSRGLIVICFNADKIILTQE